MAHAMAAGVVLLWQLHPRAMPVSADSPASVQATGRTAVKSDPPPKSVVVYGKAATTWAGARIATPPTDAPDVTGAMAGAIARVMAGAMAAVMANG